MSPESFRALARELYQRLAIKGIEPFRLSAYQRLSEAAETLPDGAFDTPSTLVEALKQTPGIGPSLLNTARDLYEKGTTPLLEELRQEIPESVLELLRIGGLGPKRIHQLWYELRIASAEKLLEAIERGRLNQLRSWGPALVERLRKNVAAYLATRHLLLYYEAAQLWEALIQTVGEVHPHLYPVGAFRRAMPLLEKVEVIAPLSQRERLLSVLAPEASGEDTQVSLAGGKILLSWVPDESLGWSLVERTGPESFVQAFQAKLVGDTAGLSEEALFRAANLPYILPQWRDWPDILSLAEGGLLPEPLEVERIQGTVHVHTTYSDGADTLEAMAEAARAMGLRYLGIADHSARAHYAGGLPPEKLLAQGQAIRTLNQKYAGQFVLLHGVEADILPDGEIDYEMSIWQKLDYLVASVHERLQMERAEATERLMRAISNPYVRILGHWTGRLLRGRPGYLIDEEAILEACAARSVAIEFNGNPYRMEIDWQWVRRASEKGVSIVLTTDAHSTAELSYLRYALPVLQKGLLAPERFLNYQGPEAFCHAALPET